MFRRLKTTETRIQRMALIWTRMPRSMTVRIALYYNTSGPLRRRCTSFPTEACSRIQMRFVTVAMLFVLHMHDVCALIAICLHSRSSSRIRFLGKRHTPALLAGAHGLHCHPHRHFSNRGCRLIQRSCLFSSQMMLMISWTTIRTMTPKLNRVEDHPQRSTLMRVNMGTIISLYVLLTFSKVSFSLRTEKRRS